MIKYFFTATGMTVMPLIQTFGHMEFALKLKKYEHLREVPDSPQSLCPSRNESINLVERMIQQVIEMHQSTVSITSKNATELLLPKFTHIHIGCDEVYRIGLCDQCQSKNRNDLFLSHVRTVAQFVRKNWPHLKVVIWDDMLRTIPLGELQRSKISKFVEPMVWVCILNCFLIRFRLPAKIGSRRSENALYFLFIMKIFFLQDHVLFVGAQGNSMNAVPRMNVNFIFTTNVCVNVCIVFHFLSEMSDEFIIY